MPARQAVRKAAGLDPWELCNIDGLLVARWVLLAYMAGSFHGY
jgi:hypothetical protein